jgi:hypothetical protein
METGERREETERDVADTDVNSQPIAGSSSGLRKGGAEEETSCWVRGDRRMASVHLRRLPLQEGSGLCAELRCAAGGGLIWDNWNLLRLHRHAS